MELTQLFSALDKAVQVVKDKRGIANTAQNIASAEIKKAQANFDTVVAAQTEKVGKANTELENAVNEARKLQEELQLRTTGFLNTQENVRTL